MVDEGLGALELERFSADDALRALEAHVRTRWLLRQGIARRLRVESFEPTGAFDVVFASWVEERGTARAERPYRGGAVDGPERGAAPDPWAVELARPPVWTAERRELPLPHTEEVRECGDCGGDGRVRCSSCGGDGRVACSWCGGSGSVTRTRTVTSTDANGHTTTSTESYSESCSCIGGTVTCSSCGGDGRVTCGSCEGEGRLVHFVRLDVVWRQHVTRQVLEKTDLPDNLVPKARGVAVVDEEAPRVEAAAGGAGPGPYREGGGRVNPEVNAAANELIAGHVFPAAVRPHRQRLLVRAVPVYEARYAWRDGGRRFWVFGTDRKVHAPEFPVSVGRIGLLVAAVLALVGGAIALVLIR